MLTKVGVGALGAIELVSSDVSAGGWCIAGWIRNFGSFAIAASIDGVPVVKEEGGGCGEDDVAK